MRVAARRTTKNVKALSPQIFKQTKSITRLKVPGQGINRLNLKIILFKNLYYQYYQNINNISRLLIIALDHRSNITDANLEEVAHKIRCSNLQTLNLYLHVS